VLIVVVNHMFSFLEGLEFSGHYILLNVEITKPNVDFWMQGLRAFLPLKEFVNRPKTLEDYVSWRNSSTRSCFILL
jgi:hypothetical protein